MSSFDKVIGYRSIKRELLQICDMIRNRTIYEEMGAHLPHGLLLYGAPGLGKSLLANCFMEECGLNTVTVRRDKSSDAFINSMDLFEFINSRDIRAYSFAHDESGSP